MAIVINSDGTVSTIETTHDQYGNIRPKMPTDNSTAPAESVSNRATNTINSSRQREIHTIYPTEYATKPKVKVSPNKPKSKQVAKPKQTKPRYIFTTIGEINEFFKKRRLNGREVLFIEFSNISELLPNCLKNYFKKRYLEYKEHLSHVMTIKSRELAEKIQQQKPKKEVQQKGKNSHPRSSGFTLGDILSSSSKQALYASSSDFDVRTSNPPKPARPPQYAYARDRYGRVQERDCFNEEKKNEFYVAQNRQRNYDYSSYDDNDDSDGAYSDWE